MNNNHPLDVIIAKAWRVRRVRNASETYPEWVIEFDDQEGHRHTERTKVATICGPAELAMAFKTLPEFITSAGLASFRINTVLQNANSVIEGHRAGLKEALKLLMNALEQTGWVEHIPVLKQISS